jgi:hypothetical protein
VATSQGIFIPKNPKKVVGNQTIQFRSSWELKIMRFLDEHPSVIQWASESIKIPYYDPVTQRNRYYIPDFLVMYLDKQGRQRAELVEVKPAKESMMENAKSKRDKLAIATNSAKWTAAMAWSKKSGVTFRVLTENEIFSGMGKPKKR